MIEVIPMDQAMRVIRNDLVVALVANVVDPNRNHLMIRRQADQNVVRHVLNRRIMKMEMTEHLISQRTVPYHHRNESDKIVVTVTMMAKQTMKTIDE